MRPFYFGEPGRQLFGVHDPSHADGHHDSGIVLCHPHGQEYTYAFRAYRTLALRLARRGFSVLRFDYSGTGDSEGEIDQVSPEEWIADIVAAVEEVQTSLGLSSVSLVGLRLGATLAAIAATQCRDVDRLVLWEPIIQGSEYVASLRACHREWFRDLIRVLPGARPLAAEDELLGYRFTRRFRQDLERLNLSSLATRPARKVLIVGQDKNAEQARLAEKLQELGADVEMTRVEDPRIWSMIPGMQKGLVPNRDLHQIVSWFGSHGYD